MLSHFCPLKHFNFLQSKYIYVNSCNLKVRHFLCNEKAILGIMQYKYKTLMNILFLLNNNDTFVIKKNVTNKCEPENKRIAILRKCLLCVQARPVLFKGELFCEKDVYSLQSEIHI